MDAMKADLSRESLKGFFLFLLSERHRHQEDIDMINNKLNELTNRLNLRDTEKVDLVKESLKYVKF
jgi:hypothetical protein